MKTTILPLEFGFETGQIASATVLITPKHVDRRFGKQIRKKGLQLLT